MGCAVWTEDFFAGHYFGKAAFALKILPLAAITIT
jgi:hypothetical protein